MAYVKTVWETGDVITAEKLNHAEDGIEQADAKALPDIDTDQVILPAVPVAVWGDNYEVVTEWMNRHTLMGVATHYGTNVGLVKVGIMCLCSVQGAQVSDISIPEGFRPINQTYAYLVCQTGSGLDRRFYRVAVNTNGICLADSSETALGATESLYGFILWHCGYIDS